MWLPIELETLDISGMVYGIEQRVRNASTTTKLAVADPLHRHELIGGDRELGLQEPARRKQLP